MNSQENVLEVKGEDVDQAIEAGLAQLGLDRSEVSIEVVDEGSSGFLGIGGRDAIVRLTVNVMEPEPAVEDVIPELAAVPEPATEAITTPEEDEVPEVDAALDIVNTLLEMMQMDVETSTRLTEPDDLTGQQRWIIDISGQDLGVLIGPRGETLNALQYVARLMTGHALHRRPLFIIDVEGYRTRREQALARLAERMADKAVKQGRPVSLEPMPPNERRIIHITLKDNENVFTESAGEGKRRKVRIFPKD